MPLQQALKKLGWNIRTSSSKEPLLAADIAARYSQLPVEVSHYLQTFEKYSNAEESAWFLTCADFLEPADAGFRWNEYERMALDAAESEQERRKIIEFWDAHFPIALAVDSNYDYLAISLQATSFGAVVHGYSPYWFEPSIIAPSFSEFVEQFRMAAESKTPKSPFNFFLS
jgi:hypothetical protein